MDRIKYEDDLIELKWIVMKLIACYQLSFVYETSFMYFLFIVDFFTMAKPIINLLS